MFMLTYVELGRLTTPQLVAHHIRLKRQVAYVEDHGDFLTEEETKYMEWVYLEIQRRGK